MTDATSTSVREESVGRRTARGAASVFAVRALSSGLGFLTALLLAKWLGADGYGAYVWAVAFAAVVAVPGTLGADVLLGREVAVLQVRKDWGRLHGLLRWSTTVSAACSAAIVVVIGGLILLANRGSMEAIDRAALIALLTVPISVFTRVRTGILRGLRRLGLAESPENIGRPLILLLFVGGIVVSDTPLTAERALWSFVLASGLALLLGMWFLRGKIPAEVRTATPVSDAPAWRAAGVPMLLFLAVNTVTKQADILMLGSIGTLAATGIYVVADRAAGLLDMARIATNTSLGPTFSRLLAQERHEEAKALVARSSRLIFGVLIVGAVGLAFSGRWLLSLFGPEYASSYVPLLLLCVSAVAAALSPSSAIVLVMSGRERVAAACVASATAVNVLTNAVLIPTHGAVGAGIASIAGSLILAMSTGLAARRLTGIWTFVFPSFTARR